MEDMKKKEMKIEERKEGWFVEYRDKLEKLVNDERKKNERGEHFNQTLADIEVDKLGKREIEIFMLVSEKSRLAEKKLRDYNNWIIERQNEIESKIEKEEFGEEGGWESKEETSEKEKEVKEKTDKAIKEELGHKFSFTSYVSNQAQQKKRLEEFDLDDSLEED